MAHLCALVFDDTYLMRLLFPCPRFPRWVLPVLVFTASATASFAQTDEIQVYDAAIASPGKFNLMIHNNFTPDGRKTLDFPGAVESNHALVGAAEWAYGVTPWFEQGLYLPLYSFSQNDGATYNGFKVRELFVVPHAADRTFFYGLNFEFSINENQWDPRRYTSELRPIVGWHIKPSEGSCWKPVDIIFNPNMDTSYVGGPKSLDFTPETRVAYNLSDTWAVAAEEYGDYGQFRKIDSFNDQFQQVWAVVDRKSEKWVSIEAGIGIGITNGSDRVTLKFMVSRDLN
jgi:ABC-type transport system substrate-binding protein